MTNALRKIAFAMLCFAIIGNTACTSMQTVDLTATAVTELNIKPGDTVTLFFPDASQKRITVTAIDESSIAGTDFDDQEFVADYDELATIRFEGFDVHKTALNTGKTVGLVILGVLVLGIMAVGPGMPAFAY